MLQIRALRAQLNKVLQTRRSVADVQADGREFEEQYGASIWGCVCKDTETFSDLYNAHLKRVHEEEEWEERLEGWSDRLRECLSLEAFSELESMLNNSRLKDDWMKVDELHAKGRELMHPEYLDDGGEG